MIHIESEETLDALAAQAGYALQEIQDRLGRVNRADGRIRFPRGYLHTAARLRNLLPSVGSPLQRHNASYGLMMADVLRWLAIRTDLYGPALSMVVKESICIYGVICDWLSKEATRGHGSRKRFSYRSNKLVELNIIGRELEVELNWLWEIRCNEHFHEVDELEHERYTRADHNRARKAFRLLVGQIRRHVEENA